MRTGAVRIGLARGARGARLVALALAVTFLSSACGRAVHTQHASSSGTRVVSLEVGGMVCSDCVARVQRQLVAVPGVSSVDVDLARQRAQVTCDASVADTALTGAVRRAGPDFVGFVVSR